MASLEIDPQELRSQIWEQGFTELLGNFQLASQNDPEIEEKLFAP